MKHPKWHGKRFYSFDSYLKNTFGKKLYKVSLDAGCTCPTRDGSKGYGGCTFCSTAGSGDFASAANLSIREQIDQGIALLGKKAEGSEYIAYFQAFTSTYGDADRLRSLYMEAIQHEKVAAISIATRPDCLPPEILEVLSEIGQIKPLFVELGLQTIHEETARAFHRGYELAVFEKAVHELTSRSIPVIVHLILGLPGESREDMLASVRYLNSLPIQGVKLSMLHVLKGTAMGEQYLREGFPVFTLEEYVDLLIACLEELEERIVVHRITGDGPKSLLLAPLWSGNKRLVLNTIAHEMKTRDTYQGVNVR